MPRSLPRKAPSPSIGTPIRVTVVAVPLTLTDGDLGRLEPLLPPAERDRAGRLVGPLRRRFVAGRGRLRIVLGRVLGVAPDRLVLGAGAQGKPFLAGAEAGALHFNLAHSGDACLIALSPDAAVGIDLEVAAPAHTPAWVERMAGSILAPAERSAVLGEPPAQRPAALLKAWVIKEAIVKGTGAGIGAGVGHLVIASPPPRVPLVAGAAPRRVDLAPVSPPWHVALLDGAAGTFAALACPGSVCELGFTTFDAGNFGDGRDDTAAP